MIKAISYAKVNTDKANAKTLAELLRADLIPQAYQVKPARRRLRELTQGRLRMIQWRGKLQSTLWNLAAKYTVRISGTQRRYPGKLQCWLQPKLPPATKLQAHIYRIEEDIEKQIPFEASAERLMAVTGRFWPRLKTSTGFPVPNNS